MKYSVVLKNEDGSQEKKEVEALSRFAVYEQVEQGGATVVSLEEKTGIALPHFLNFNLTTGIKTEERIIFVKNLGAMLKAGLTLSRALSVIERQTSNKTLKKVVLSLEDEVKKGTSFHEALEKHKNIFSKLFIAMTKAGEESGTLAESFRVVATQMERAYTLTKKIKGAMIYPAIIIFAIIVIGILMMIYVVPTLSATFKELGVVLPFATRAVIAISDFMVNNIVVVIPGLILSFALLFTFLRTKVGGAIVLAVSLQIPVVGTLVRQTFCARISRSLSSLLSSGVEMLTAIDITKEVVGDNIFGRVVDEAGVNVKKGEPLSKAFIGHPKLYPVLMGDMIAVGEETGQVSTMLQQVAEYYEADVEEGTKDLSTIIEPALMLLVGAGVGVFALAMITPIYSLSSAI